MTDESKLDEIKYKLPPVLFDQTQACFAKIEAELKGPLLAYCNGPRGSVCQSLGYQTSYGSLSGTFTLSFGGYTTSAISVGASAATVKSALEGLASIGSGNVAVIKSISTSSEELWTINFVRVRVHRH